MSLAWFSTNILENSDNLLELVHAQAAQALIATIMNMIDR